ncbi:methyltransferase domain-containing protein [Candidatus Nomurabacteria bacterium]|nr:methyltransferase domain-containing protein [Candidatus Kaiserbacteria bacterium]MCB9815303.1 methyltransferase domain-containing protein [Candidatus Nomurabacteria bacterium]
MNISVGGTFVIPDVVVTQFHLREGDMVADFGAGSGFFLPALSQTVGETGRVFACEIQKALVERLGDQARLQKLSNIHPLWCDLEEPNGIKIPTGELDAGVLVNTFFMMEDKNAAVAEMGRTVRAGGKFFVIDWTESFAGMGPAPDHVVTAEESTAIFESNGFVFEREYPAGGHHYGLAFRKL